jgi:hypothetical protein
MYIGIMVAMIVALALLAYANVASYHAMQEQKAAFNELANVHDIRVELWSRYERILEDTPGGVEKRIANCRNITKVILEHEPELFLKCPTLVHWLRATDEFLVTLYAVPVMHKRSVAPIDACPQIYTKAEEAARRIALRSMIKIVSSETSVPPLGGGSGHDDVRSCARSIP